MASSGGIERTQSEPMPLWRGLLRVQGRQNLRAYLWLLAGGLMLANLYMIFMVAPTDADLGHVQRIFYFHVPMAIISFVAFLIVFIGSLIYVFRRESKWDNLAYAAAEVGVVFISLALITRNRASKAAAGGFRRSISGNMSVGLFNRSGGIAGRG